MCYSWNKCMSKLDSELCWENKLKSTVTIFPLLFTQASCPGQYMQAPQCKQPRTHHVKWLCHPPSPPNPCRQTLLTLNNHHWFCFSVLMRFWPLFNLTLQHPAVGHGWAWHANQLSTTTLAEQLSLLLLISSKELWPSVGFNLFSHFCAGAKKI